MQKVQFQNLGATEESNQNLEVQGLELRKRIFSLDNQSFPGFEDMIAEGGKKGQAIKKFSGVSTVDSTGKLESQYSEGKYGSKSNKSRKSVKLVREEILPAQNSETVGQIEEKEKPRVHFEEEEAEDQHEEDEYAQFDEFGKAEDLKYLRFNRVKSQTSDTNCSEAENQKVQQKLTALKAKGDNKRRASLIDLTNNLFNYKDMEVDQDKKCQERDYTRSCNFVFIGPQGSGKSTVCGHILYSTGSVNKNEVKTCQQFAKANHSAAECEDNHNEKEIAAMWPKYLLDLTEDEKRSGFSMEIGKETFLHKESCFTILDSPGNPNYTQAIIKGAAIAEIAVVVVSAKKQELKASLDNQQIHELLKISKGFGIQQLVIAVNKMDSVKWSKKKFDQIKESLEPELTKLGFLRSNIQFIPISAGLNEQNISKSAQADWYHGKHLLEALAHSATIKDDFKKDTSNNNLKVEVFGIQQDKGNILVNVQIKEGTLRPGQTLTILPSNMPAQALELFDGQGKSVNQIYAGELATFKVNIAHESNIQIGTIMTDREQSRHVPVADKLKVQVKLIPKGEKKLFITNGYCCIMHHGTSSYRVHIERITKCDLIGDGSETAVSPSKYITQAANIECIIESEEEIVVGKGDHFILRDSDNSTFGLGRIQKYIPIPHPIDVFQLENNRRQRLIRKEYESSDLKDRLVKTFKTLQGLMERMNESEEDKDTCLKESLNKMKQVNNNFITDI